MSKRELLATGSTRKTRPEPNGNRKLPYERESASLQFIPLRRWFYSDLTEQHAASGVQFAA